MPIFRDVQAKVDFWLPVDRVIHMQSAPGGLTTVVRAMLMTEKGPALGVFEVEGRCSVLGAAIDAGSPTEVGQ